MGVSLNNADFEMLVQANEMLAFTYKDIKSMPVVIKSSEGEESHFYIDVKDGKVILTPNSFYKKDEASQKYEILKEEKNKSLGTECYRIRALKDLPSHGVKKGDLGGWIESDKNLSQEGDCWVDGNAAVLDNACVKDNALVTDEAYIADNAIVQDNAVVSNGAEVINSATVKGNALVKGHSTVAKQAIVSEAAAVVGYATVTDFAHVCGEACVRGESYIEDSAIVEGIVNSSHVGGEVKILPGVYINNAVICGKDIVISHNDDILVLPAPLMPFKELTYVCDKDVWCAMDSEEFRPCTFTTKSLTEWAKKREDIDYMCIHLIISTAKGLKQCIQISRDRK